jgi:hypothetical protein
VKIAAIGLTKKKGGNSEEEALKEKYLKKSA